jgi:hypothetical protein
MGRSVQPARPRCLSNFSAEGATNHQVAESPVRGRAAIREMFRQEFDVAEMVCIVENIFQDGEWAILEWRDPKGLRGCWVVSCCRWLHRFHSANNE